MPRCRCLPLGSLSHCTGFCLCVRPPLHTTVCLAHELKLPLRCQPRAPTRPWPEQGPSSVKPLPPLALPSAQLLGWPPPGPPGSPPRAGECPLCSRSQMFPEGRKLQRGAGEGQHVCKYSTVVNRIPNKRAFFFYRF